MNKAIFSLATMVLLALPAVGQPVLQRGAEGKAFSAEELLSVPYAGRHEGHDVWVARGKRDAKQIVGTTLDLLTTEVATLPRSADLEVLTASLDNQGHCALMLADRADSKRSLVLAFRSDATDGYDTLLAWRHGRRDKCMVWGATSPSGQYNALVSVLQLMETKQYRTYIALYDAALHRLWEREFALGSMHDLVVTDSGRVVTIGIDDDGQEAHFVFNVMDARSAQSYDVAVKCDPVKQIRLASVVGDVAVALGVYEPVDVRKVERLTAGVIGLAFDVTTAELKGVTMRPFQNEDMNIFYNKKTKKIQRSQVCEDVKVLDVVPASYGGVIALSHQWVEEEYDDGGSTRVGHALGVHLAAVDTTGHVRWVRNLRRAAKQKGGDEMLQVGVAALAGRTAVVLNEHPKEPAIYDIAGAARVWTPGDKSNVVIYTIDDDGKTQKLLLEAKSKLTLLRALSTPDGALLYLGSHGNKVRAAELKMGD